MQAVSWKVCAIYIRAFNDASLVRNHFRKAGGREFFASDQGSIGWAPPGAKAGDEICVFHGCKLPFVIRGAAQLGIIA